MLQLCIQKELRFHAGHFSACSQNAVCKLPHQPAAGAAVDQRISAFADPASQRLHRLLQSWVIALVCAQIDCDIHSSSLLLFLPIIPHFSQKRNRLDSTAARRYVESNNCP